MSKNMLFVFSWLVLATVTSVVWFLRFHSILFVVFAVSGNLIGFLIPVFMDIFLPRIMRTEVTLNRQMATDVLKEGLNQVKQGNLHTTQPVQTPLRSYPLLVAYVLASFFIITSTGSFIGRGFVIGLGLSLTLDLLFSLHPIEYLKDRWFSVFHANLTETEFGYFVYGSFGIYSLLVILALLA